MGSVNLLVPKSLTEIQSRMLLQAHFVDTFDFIPLPTKTLLIGNVLTLEKDGHESSYVEVAWPMTSRGLTRVRTATLITNNQPYYLLQELCRGKLNQLRLKIIEWDTADNVIPPTIHEQLRQLIRQLNSSIDDPLSDESIQIATRTLDKTIELSDSILHLITPKWSESHGRSKTPCRVELVVDAIPDLEWNESFNNAVTAIRIVPSWSQIEPTEYGYNWLEFDRLLEWAESTELPIAIGPLLDFSNAKFPDWITQWSGDLQSLAAYSCDFVQTIIRRYKSVEATWHIFDGMNHADRLEMNEDTRIQLAARLLDASKQIHPLGEWIIGIDQPWGDYLLQDQHTYSPLIFVDTLIRAGYYFNELNVAIHPNLLQDQEQSRTALDVIELIEQFRQIGTSIKLTVLDVSPTQQWPEDGEVHNRTLQSLELILKLSDALPTIETFSLNVTSTDKPPTTLLKILNRHQTSHNE